MVFFVQIVAKICHFNGMVGLHDHPTPFNLLNNDLFYFSSHFFKLADLLHQLKTIEIYSRSPVNYSPLRNMQVIWPAYSVSPIYLVAW
ncbi:hypothetical protein PITCH_A560025 [uncultured Desulfobacterium sp.]|uniref:Uncharacterized protein n=1 Tax=uncultured Desulfobacterium sp. TaxID=201089 RepID=A0A445N0X0_9BACT|nr:hypothetical protein PITCH_A560025 [uncultured Desulfobacterium sp.]